MSQLPTVPPLLVSRYRFSCQRLSCILKGRRYPAAVVLSIGEYERLRGLNIAEFSEFCNAIGGRAKERGLTEAELAKLLAED